VSHQQATDGLWDTSGGHLVDLQKIGELNESQKQ